ncbi:DUF1311 domain-containing protein [Methylobacterium terricola]|uniref:DUF1311 domain-containing protein n=1 Tax=Methylobacterium terricola TaxID=2583531 RepID=A0A5C4LP10_9HYPH|nr:lysozyme inhibitor LprI family protein [Methylobacterium terricola]TNC15231.1 DUF1311 domain-containing protein [Methylobacterium terricola]
MRRKISYDHGHRHDDRHIRASSHVDHTICDGPRLLKADAAMGKAYTALLEIVPKPSIYAMLVASQKRWIAARDTQFGNLVGTLI